MTNLCNTQTFVIIKKMTELNSEGTPLPSSVKTKEQPQLIYFVDCAKDGRQDVTKDDTNDWGDEVAELMGKRMVTANCPTCHSTLKVTTQPVSPQPAAETSKEAH